MNDHLELTIRRIDGSWRVSANGLELEHTHSHPFRTEKAAQRFSSRVRQALDSGRDLNLEHWEYTGPAQPSMRLIKAMAQRRRAARKSARS